jgi:hypothetical protein
VTLVKEGLLAMRGCWRFLWRDPAAFEDFNLTIEGFWRSFAMLVPVLVMAYPILILDHRAAVEVAPTSESPPELRLSAAYLCLLINVAIWPIVAAGLALLFDAAQNYVRYMIVYNWISVPLMALSMISYLVYQATGAGALFYILIYAVFFLGLYASWYVARAGLQTTILIAFAFLLADTAVTKGLSALIR